MPALPAERLAEVLLGPLPNGTQILSDPSDVRPMLLNIPGFGQVRIYLWTCTADRSAEGRPLGEFKIQIILPWQQRGQRGHLEIGGSYTALLGYSPDYGVFVGWEADLYDNVGYSANVQTREELLEVAREVGWSVLSPRALRQRIRPEEVRVAFTPGNLLPYLQASQTADQRGLYGMARTAFMLAQAPGQTHAAPPAPALLDDAFIERERQRILTSRLLRDATFGSRVRQEYGDACAVCAVQLPLIEGAHIIPVGDQLSQDEVWNGIALCRNHHRLFDVRLFHVAPDLRVRLDGPALAFLTESHRDRGADALLVPFQDQRITEPAFYGNGNLRQMMEWALRTRLEMAGLKA